MSQNHNKQNRLSRPWNMTCAVSMAFFILFFYSCSGGGQSRSVVSPGFDISKYDMAIISRPEASSVLYGIDVEIGNLFNSYNIKPIGDKESVKLSELERGHCLIVRYSGTTGENFTIATITLEDLISGRAMYSTTRQMKGSMAKDGIRYDKLLEIIKPIEQLLIDQKGTKVNIQK